MGTRSITVIKDENGEEICVLYRQFDGYPSGMGKDLKKFLSPIRLVNGITDKEDHPIANGMSCLAAQIVAHFKSEDRSKCGSLAGNIYLYPAGTRDAGEEYIYTIYPGENGKVRMRVQAGCMTMFGLPGTKQTNMPVLYDGYAYRFNLKRIEKKLESLDEEDTPNDWIESQNSE